MIENDINYKNKKFRERQNKMKKLLSKILLLLILGSITYVGIQIYQEYKIKDYSDNERTDKIATKQSGKKTKEQKTNLETKNPNQKEQEKIDLKLIDKEYKGYAVDAKLKIDILNIDTYVLKEYSKAGMEVCVSKYYGTEPNEVGNYCIAGHNYITKNMFSKLGELEIGDEIILTDNYNGAVHYTIYDKYKAKPEQTEPLSQNTNGNIELTLITCSDYSSKRIIIKARADKLLVTRNARY